MISFACKQINFSDLVKCSFSLNKTEYDLFMFLLDQSDSLCAATLGERSGKDRTTVQKAIKKLLNQGLVEKHQINLESGGYTFVYKIKNKEYLRHTMLQTVNAWHKTVVDSVQKW